MHCINSKGHVSSFGCLIPNTSQLGVKSLHLAYISDKFNFGSHLGIYYTELKTNFISVIKTVN
jgi:hypothetical protein